MRFILSMTSLLLACSPQVPLPPQPPVHVFDAWNGDWSGTFAGYDPTGKELYRLRVEQSYHRQSDTTQDVRIRDTMPDGTVITGRGKNTAHRNLDGTLDLRCTVEKSNGDRVEHRGRLIRGPSGNEEIVWYSTSKDRCETFREGIVNCEGRTHYFIHGMGRYADSLVLMAGRYEKQN